MAGLKGGFFLILANKNLGLIFLKRNLQKTACGRYPRQSCWRWKTRERGFSTATARVQSGPPRINKVTTESVEFVESGVILRVIPSVDQQGRILLKVHPEVSSATLSAGIPSKKSTEVTTELLSEDGQAIFIGGLIKKSSRKDKTGVPILGDIPGIGRLFSTTTESVNNTETVIIISPRIIQNSLAASALAEGKLEQIDDAAKLIIDHQLRLESSELKDKIGVSDFQSVNAE